MNCFVLVLLLLLFLSTTPLPHHPDQAPKVLVASFLKDLFLKGAQGVPPGFLPLAEGAHGLCVA